MSSRIAPYGRLRLRRLTAMLAMLGLIFASTIASVSHSLAMPMMGGTQMAGDHSHNSGHRLDADDDHHDHAADHQHHHGEQGLADGPQEENSGPCDQGCLFCKDCSLCSLANLAPALVVRDLHGQSYQDAALKPLADVTLPTLAEPPRV